jgi:hypothetical protein
MTKQEACNIENMCDSTMSHYLNEECNVSMALTGKLKIQFEDGYFTLNRDFTSADWINYTGFYDNLQDYIASAIKCVTDHRNLFDRLIWSYEHITELE